VALNSKDAVDAGSFGGFTHLNSHKAFIDIRLRPRYRNAASRASPYRPLRPNVASS